MYNYLTRIDFVWKLFYEYGRNYRKYLYKCSCWNTKYLKRSWNVMSKSCWCKRWFRHGMSYTRFYRIWVGMDRRCNYISDDSYDRYWGRGIKLKWANFQDFKKDMYSSYVEHLDIYWKQNTTIDRIDNNWHYCKKNCRWATKKEQANNNSHIRYITIWNETYNILERASKFWVRPNLISKRLSRWRDEKTAVTKPITK